MLLEFCKRCQMRDKLLVRQLVALKTSERTLFGFGKKTKKESEEESKQLIPSHVLEEEPIVMSEEEVMKMRDKSRLPSHIKSEITLKDIPKMRYLWQFRHAVVRKRYATYGKASGLKPGVMWPSKEELQYIKAYEQTFHRPFYEMVSKAKAIQDEREDSHQKRRQLIEDNLKQLPKWKKEFWDKYKKMNDDIEAEKQKKEKLIQEVREFVGYDLDPKDPRFEEALVKKDEENKRLSKAARKQERQKQTLERLQALANEAMEREKDEQNILEKSKTQKQKDQQSVDSNQTPNKTNSEEK